MKQEEERCCGNCCWFYAEDTDGYGCCPFQFGEVVACDRSCKSPDDFVGEEEMRHHMAVLLQAKRWEEEMSKGRDHRWTPITFRRYPKNEEMITALGFAYKYMKVFSKL